MNKLITAIDDGYLNNDKKRENKIQFYLIESFHDFIECAINILNHINEIQL